MKGDHPVDAYTSSALYLHVAERRDRGDCKTLNSRAFVHMGKAGSRLSESIEASIYFSPVAKRV